MIHYYSFVKKFFIVTFVCIMVASCATTQNTATTAFPSAPMVTGSAENLTRETSDASDEFYPRISPDGKFLLYNAIETTSFISFDGSFLNPTVKTNKKSKIVKKEIGKPITNPLVNFGSDPTWLPDGSGVIFAYVKPSKSVIVRTNNEGVGLNYISQGEMGDDDAQPSVSRDGNKIIFTTILGNARMICSMDANGGKYTVITEGSRVSIHPTDANKIIYNLKVGAFWQCFMMDLKTGQKSQITTGDYNNRDAAFTRDGRRIAFVSNRENPKKNNHHVYVMNADGTGVIQLTQGETNEGDPTWGPDGMLYFYSNASKNYNIWKMKPKI